MALRAKKPCAHPHCREVVAPPARFCSAHHTDAGQYDRERGNAQQRGYGRRWQVARIGYLAAHPLCGDRRADAYNVGQFTVRTQHGARYTDSRCKALGLIVAATVVDHIYDHKGDPVLFWDPHNRAALCATCHNQKPPRPWPPRTAGK